MSQPLENVRVVEMAGYPPVSHAGQLLADLGADIVRIDRDQSTSDGPRTLDRGRRRIVLNLKDPVGLADAQEIIARADVVVEGFRPGVMERLGLGPDQVWEKNPGLVFARLTGWGQEGPMAPFAGHDLNFLALSGLLSAMGSPDTPPQPPLNLVGDFGGGSVMLAFGVSVALLDRQRTGRGQIVDAAMSDGVVSLGSYIYDQLSAGIWSPRRGVNRLDGAAPFYRVYRTGDGEFLAVAALETQFRNRLLDVLDLDEDHFGDTDDPDNWPGLTAAIATRIGGKTRSEWEQIFADVDACVTPVLRLDEAPHHPHHQHRTSFRSVTDWIQPGPAPRLSRHAKTTALVARDCGAAEVLETWADHQSTTAQGAESR